MVFGFLDGEAEVLAAVLERRISDIILQKTITKTDQYEMEQCETMLERLEEMGVVPWSGV